MNRAERRRAEALADRALAKLPFLIDCVPSRDVAIVRERGAPIIVPEVDAGNVLGPLGLLSVLDEIRQARETFDGARLPTVIIAGGHASVAMMPVKVLSAGGQA